MLGGWGVMVVLVLVQSISPALYSAALSPSRVTLLRKPWEGRLRDSSGPWPGGGLFSRSCCGGHLSGAQALPGRHRAR